MIARENDAFIDHEPEWRGFPITERKTAGISYARLSERLLEAQDEERRRIARELHDGIGQHLAAMEMSLVAALDSSEEIPATARTLLSDCLATARQCSQETRTMSQLLHPPLLEVVGLVVAIREYVKGFSKRSGMRVDFRAPAEVPPLDRGIETAALRIVQESLMNVYRHSGSQDAVVGVEWGTRYLAVEVQDFGRGIPAGILEDGDDAAQTGVGLQGMRCRVQQLGGALAVRSDEKGTRVRAVLPSEPLRG
jgi:two-component system NarL family sensor kinase